MSVYNQGSRTQILDPIIDLENNRVEWRLNSNSCYSSNIRILNLGLTTTGTKTKYNRLAGALGTVKNIFLMDGQGQTLDQLLDANKFLGFKMFNKGHNESRSLSRNLVGNSLGNVMDSDSRLGRVIADKPIGITQALSGKSMLVLSDALAMLRNTKILPTTIFKELRVVIEFETRPDKLAQVDNQILRTLPNPLLVVEEILDPSTVSTLTKGFNGVGWLSIERDQNHFSTNLADDGVAASAAGKQVVNNKNLLFKGFDNKYLHRILVLTQPTKATANALADHAVIGGGGLDSIPLINPAFQFVINGRNKITSTGLTRSSEIMDKLTQTWGENSCMTGGNTTTLFENQTVINTSKDFMARQSYVGISIEEMIQDFSLNLTFTAQFNNRAATASDIWLDQYNSPLDIVIFGECRKSIIIGKDGGYIISYN